MRTTTLGAYPKPHYVPISDWFSVSDGDYTSAFEGELVSAGKGAEALFVRAAREVIAGQVSAGIDVVTDGEVRRENYIHYQCRHIDGFDFRSLGSKRMRDTTDALLPRITGPVAPRSSPLVHDYRVANPGPGGRGVSRRQRARAGRAGRPSVRG